MEEVCVRVKAGRPVPVPGAGRLLMSVTADRPVKLTLRIQPGFGTEVEPMHLAPREPRLPVEGVHVLLVPRYTSAFYTADSDCGLTFRTAPQPPTPPVIRQVLPRGRCLCSGAGMVMFDRLWDGRANPSDVVLRPGESP